jgi:endo-1,4-beta-xylanase
MKSTLALLVPLVAALPSEKRQATASIHDAFVAAGKEYFGVATDTQLLGQDPNAAIIQANFGQITHENSMKWGSLEATQGSLNWAPADEVVDWATENGKLIRGHTLIWHSQLPTWVDAIGDADTLRQVIRDHVSTVVGRYAGKILQWDVCNEILAEDGTLRDSVFSRLLGEEFVQIAFEEARAADPAAKLYINDYNLDQAGYGKVNGMTDLVAKWIAAGVPIDGIGSQTHISGGMGGNTQAALEQLASSGVSEVALTEVDIAYSPTEDYNAITQACLNVPQCVGITVWGVSDATSWRQGEDPLLFDASYQPKPAYDSIVQLLGGA